MTIVVDSAIPYIEGVFEPFFDRVVCRVGGDISSADLANASALIIRTRTRCGEELLRNSAVKFIATATIGTDHIDMDYCAKRGIKVFSAAGCNARAVSQWVFAAIEQMGLSGVLGVVGVGNVGGEVCRMAEDRGFTVLKNDPPRAESGEDGFVEIGDLLAHADIVTLHVPLNPYTRSMVDPLFLSRMKSGAVLLNSSRGEVVDENAMAHFGGRFALDVWQGEPKINVALMQRATIATPHVAGYSARGKARASEMCIRALGEFFAIEPLRRWSPKGEFALEMPENYDITIDDKALRADPSAFESLRRVRQ